MKKFIIYNNLGIILRVGECPYYQMQYQINDGEFLIEGIANPSTQMVINGVLVDKPITTDQPDPILLLSQAKSQKSLEIQTACRLHIYQGYNSIALGNLYHYPSKDRDQANMIASVTDSYNPENPPDWTTPFWCNSPNGVWDFRPHTATEIRRVGAAGKAHIAACQLKNAQLQAQIQLATTPEELNSITW